MSLDTLMLILESGGKEMTKYPFYQQTEVENVTSYIDLNRHAHALRGDNCSPLFAGMNTYKLFFSVLLFYPYLPTLLLGQDMTQGQFFKRSLTGLNSEFSFS